jgi:hypothetical protein
METLFLPALFARVILMTYIMYWWNASTLILNPFAPPLFVKHSAPYKMSLTSRLLQLPTPRP